MPRPLEGTTAVVTGASSGIGEATARTLAAAGATVAMVARRLDRLDALAREIAEEGAGRAHPYEVDVTDADAVRQALDAVATDLGGIGVLVNNAGYGVWAPAMDADLDEWRRMVDVNLTGVLATTHAALPHLADAADGPRGVADVVTVSSIGGRKIPSPQSNVYSATKFGVGAFSEALRQELAERHVRVGLVEPGVVVTELTTRGGNNAPDATSPTGLGFLAADDVADAIAYMVTRPAHAAINEILLRPTEQVR